MNRKTGDSSSSPGTIFDLLPVFASVLVVVYLFHMPYTMLTIKNTPYGKAIEYQSPQGLQWYGRVFRMGQCIEIHSGLNPQELKHEILESMKGLEALMQYLDEQKEE